MEYIGRNSPCNCGSGKKYKKCCLSKDEAKNNPYLMIKNAGNYPIEFCLIKEGWQNDGLASILIVRKNHEMNKFLYSNFLIDTFCLGLKNVYFNIGVDMSHIDLMLNAQPWNMEAIDYETCRGLILGAIDYAKSLGFEPHKEWNDNKNFVEADKPYTTKHRFGKNGKPFYVQGPDDNVKAILKILGNQGEYVLNEEEL
jgi:hypothetical protein